MDFLIRRLAVSIRMPRAALARPPAPRGTGRAAAERAGSFNSGKNVTVLPVVKARRAVTGKNDVLPD